MKHIYLFLLLLCASASTVVAENIPDSLLTERYIRRIHLREPRRALQLLDVAEERRLPQMPLYHIDMLRSMCYEATGELNLKVQYARRALQNDSVRLVPRRRLSMLVALASALEVMDKYEESIRLCTEAVELARNQNNVSEEGRALFIMGCAYDGIGHPDKAVESFHEGIRLMENSDNVRILAQLSTTYGELMTVQMLHNRWEEAVETGREREALVERMARMPGPPPGYIDQQWAYAYSKLALALQHRHRETEAADYARRFMQTDFARHPMRRSEIVPYLLEARRYKEALQLNDSVETLFRKDTVSYGYSALLERYARAYRGMGQYDRSDHYQLRLAVLQDSLYAREKESRAQEYAVLYELKEKEVQLVEAQVVAQRRIFMFVIVSSILLLVTALLVIVWHNWNKTRRRNRLAVKQINELVEQRQELHKAFKVLEADYAGLKSTVEAVATASVTEEPLPPSDATPQAPAGHNALASGAMEKTGKKDARDYALFMRMERMLMDEKLFLQPKFGRDDLSRVGGVSKNELPRLLQKYANADNVSDYLNRLRVEHSVKLMKEQPYLSMDAIAQEINLSRSTFFRAFTKVFGFSPAQYIKALKETEQEAG